MKKIIFIFIFIFCVLLTVSAQKVEPIFPYNTPSLEELKNLALDSTSVKGKAYLDFLTNSLNNNELRDTTFKIVGSVKARVRFIFSHLYWEEFPLNEGRYTNSGFDPIKGVIVPSVGHEFPDAFHWVFQFGSITSAKIKGNCGNIITLFWRWDKKPLPGKTKDTPPIIPLPVTQKVDLWIKVGEKDDHALDKTRTITPTSILYGDTTIAQFDVVPDLHITNYIKKAKKHLLIGFGGVAIGSVGYGLSMLFEVPTFVYDNGLDPFDPNNRWLQTNLKSRKDLNKLKVGRGVCIGLQALGAIELIHGYCLLRNAQVDIAPQKVTLRIVLFNKNKH